MLIRGGIRTIVDLSLFASVGYAVQTWLGGNVLAWIVAIGVVLLIAATWIGLRVPGDVGLPVPVTISISGRTRLLLELTITAIAAYGLWTTVSRAAGETLLTLVGVHYAVTWDRVRWLLVGTSSPDAQA